MRLLYRPETSERVLRRAREVVDDHGVVAFPTETFYGLGASVFDERACRRVFELKGRPEDKALPCILGHVDQLDRVASELTPLALRLASRFWPGPLTLVLRAAEGVAAASNDGTIAVRVSGSELARELASACGPLTSTSANSAGGTPAETAEAVESVFPEGIDLVIDGGPAPGGAPSTIVDATGARPVLLRAGAVSLEEVLAPPS